MIYDAAARCWRAVNPATVARWTAWRLAHPGWHAPLRTALEASIACGKPAALAAALASMLAPPAVTGAAGPAGPQALDAVWLSQWEFARGGTLARSPSMPPGGSRAVGGAFVGPAGPAAIGSRFGEVPAIARLDTSAVPQDVPEPGSLALLGAGALLAAFARRARQA